MTFDPSSPAFVDDPYATYRELRQSDPVHRSPAGAWVITRYDDVHAALADERLSNAPARYAVVAPRNRERYVCADVAANILPFLDPPEHTELRRTIGRAFVERLRASPPDVPGLGHALVDGWSPGPVDLVGDFASPLSVHVIGSLLGIPERDRPRLERWSETFFYLFASIPSREVRDRLDAELSEFRGYLRGTVAERRQEPREDLISDLVLRVDDHPAAAAALVDNLMLLFADGVENVDRAIGNAVWSLLQDGVAWSRLRDDAGLVPGAVDECLRYETPGQYIARIARTSFELHGTTVSEGDHVLLVLGSANRDEARFAQPDQLDITRDPNPHLAFGRGRHSCLGGPLVERQMHDALFVLLERAPEMRAVASRPRWVPRPAHRWIESVLVEVSAAP